MNRFTLRRIGFSLVGGLAAVSLIAVLVAEVDAAGIGRAGEAGGLTWLAPVIVGAAIGVVAWLALHALPKDEDAPLLIGHGCPACGRLILDDWRLCPHCGTLVQRETDEAGKHTAS